MLGTSDPLAAAREALERSGQFELDAGPGLVARRRRRLPSRGLFRLLIPRVVVSIAADGPQPQISVRPDRWAWLIGVLCAGGVWVELTMDRARYPRDYPPAFIFGLAGLFGLGLVIELLRSKAAAQSALAATRRG